MNRLIQLIAVFGGFTASTAMAHTGIHASGSFFSGLTHPFIGLDHLLAMVAVGIWAVQLGGRQMLAVPSAFVTFMAVGAALGATGIALPNVEGMIAVSVLVLGLLVALALRAAWYWAAGLIAIFALFHGAAHGAEMPDFAAPWQYFAGFLLATAVLHAVGIGAGAALRRHPAMLRFGGVAIGLAGGWLLLTA